MAAAPPTVELCSIAIDLRDDWAAPLIDAGFDPSQPSAWIAEGLFGYLPPEGQDRLLDMVTQLSAPGSMLGTEAVPYHADLDYDDAREKMQAATEKWRELGFDLDFSQLTFEGERHDVAEYLDTRGWKSDLVTMSTLLADKGYPAMPQADGAPSMADVQYVTSIRG